MGASASKQLLTLCKEDDNEQKALDFLESQWFLDLDYSAAKDGNTMLHWAAYTGKARVARSLVQKGADPNKHNHLGSTPLMVACRYGKEGVVEALMEFPSTNVNVVTTSKQASVEGKNSLTVAACCNQRRICEILFEHGAQIQDSTLTQVCFLMDGSDMMNLMLEHGAKVNTSDNGWTPLMTAIVLRNMPLVEILASHEEVDLNIQNEEGYTALHCAYSTGDDDIINYLLEQGADPSTKAKNGKLAKDLCSESTEEISEHSRKFNSRRRQSPSSDQPAKRRKVSKEAFGEESELHHEHQLQPTSLPEDPTNNLPLSIQPLESNTISTQTLDSHILSKTETLGPAPSDVVG